MAGEVSWAAPACGVGTWPMKAMEHSGMRVMFVGIGAPKCATSWVHDNLRHHPKIAANPIKEIHYFDQAYGTDPSLFPHRITQVQKIYESYKDSAGTTPNAFALEWLERYLSPVPMDDQWYLSLFEHVPDDSVGMDMSPGYSTIPMEGFQHLRRTLPNARILFQMRNPVERCWSQFRRDVIEVINKPLSTDQIFRVVNKPEYVYSSYGETLEHLFRTFDKREVMCAFYEDIIEGPTDFMQSLCKILEIDFDLSHFPELDRRSNETGRKDAIPQEVREHLRKKHRKTYEMVAAHLGRVLKLAEGI